MSGSTEFRSIDEEVRKLLEDCAELKQTLRTIGNHVSRMEARVKRAFPVVAKQQHEKRKLLASSIESTLTAQEALAIFDTVAKLVASEASVEAERLLGDTRTSDLVAIAKELGVPFAKNKPSAKAIRKAIFGKVRESLMLTRHNNRT